MAVDLIWKHQQKTYELMKEALRKNGRAAYVFPTGCGKSFPVLKYIEENPDKKVLIVSPSKGINNQFRKYITTYINNGIQRLKDKNVQIQTYQKKAMERKITNAKTIEGKKFFEEKPDIVIVDEIQSIGATTYEPAIYDLIKRYPNAEIIGMSATPERTDGRNMAYEIFGENVIYEMSLTEALSGDKEGEVVLQTPRYIRVLSQLKEELVEYKKQIELIEDEEKRSNLLKKYQKLDTIIANSPSIQDVMVQGMQKKNGKYIVFCKDREDMLDKMNKAQEIFGKVNSKIHTDYVLSKNEAGDIVGKTDAQNRKTLEEFENRDNGEALNLLFCVDKLNLGVHIDGIDGEVLFDRTESKILYKQRIGRVLSSDKEAEETVIIDAVNNWISQIDVYREIENAIQNGGKRENRGKNYDLLKLTPEETDLLEIMRDIREELQYNTYDIYEEIIKWLETHDGKMPKRTKNLSVDEMDDLQYLETSLYNRWLYSEVRRILEVYVGKPIEEVPEEYREKIEVLRSYGLGLKKLTTYEQLIEFLETHNGEMPRKRIKDGDLELKVSQMTEEERKERNLYRRWSYTAEKDILDKYVGKPIEEVPEEYREKIETLRSYGLGLQEKTAYDEIIEWLELYNGKMPRSGIKKEGKKLKAEEQTEEEKYEFNLHARWNNSKERSILDKYVGKPIEEVPEEYRKKILRLRNLGQMGKKAKEKTAYEEIIEWLETHNGKMPGEDLAKERKNLKAEEKTQEEKDEFNLYARWRNSKEKQILDEYAGREIEEVPEEYRKKIAKLRELGQNGRKLDDKTTYERIIEWLQNNEHKLPRPEINVGKKVLRVADMTEEEKYEVRLRYAWNNSEEKRILNEYSGRPIEEVPEEYREKILRLRNLGQMGTKLIEKKEKTTYEEIIKWLQSNEGNLPRNAIKINGKSLSAKEMTEEQHYEVILRDCWNKSAEKKILDKYVGKGIEEVPEEYREKIARLRELGQIGTKPMGKREKTTYEEIIEWLDTHDGELPNGNSNGKRSKDEINLYSRWNSSKERKILNEYEERLIEEVPKEYRERIEKLRSYGLGITVYEKIIEWLENHNRQMPRGTISKNGITLNAEDMTKSEYKERQLYNIWRKAEERKILDEYAGRPIEEVPEKYRKKIAKLRSLGQLGRKKDDKIKDKMKVAVGKQVKDNDETRKELRIIKEKVKKDSDEYPGVPMN